MANIYDQIINQTFSNPAMQTSGWGKPVGSPSPQYSRQGTSGVQFNPTAGFVPGAIPTDRLPQGTAGLPNPSPGSGMTPQQVQALGGWSTDPRTGQFSYSQPNTNAAAEAASVMAQGVQLPRPRPVTTMEDVLIAQGIMPGQPMASQQGANPGLGGALIGNGVMAPGIAPQGPPPAGITPTRWAGDAPASAAPAERYRRADSTNGYNYGRSNGRWHQWDKADWAQGLTPAQQYAAANAMGANAAKQKQANATGQAGGYNYVNGKKQGYAPVQVGGQTITPTSGAQAYSLANAMGQQKAQNKAVKAPKTSSSKNNDGSWATSSSSGSPFW